MTTTYDAVVVGGGPNGLVAANLLLDAGWSVLVVEAQPQVGGAVASSRDVHPDFVHDTFSAFYPLSAGSPTIQGLHLEEHGLEWTHAPGVLGHPLPNGRWGLMARDRETTASLVDAEHAGDGEAWLALCEQWDQIGDAVVGGLLTPFPPVRPAARLLAALPRAGGLSLIRELLTPAMSMVRNRFGGEAAQLLVAGNAGHADIPLDAPGSGMMGLLLAMLGQSVGFPVPKGGAGRLAQAMEQRFLAGGGTIHCDAEVTAIEVAGGRVAAVRTRDGERYGVRRSVVADVAVPHLFGADGRGGMVAADDVPGRFRRGMPNWELDSATIKVDWALSGPIPWLSEPAIAPGTFHVGDSVEQIADAWGQVQTGLVPAAPFLLAGAMTTADPTRSPAGTESVWAYTHVPQRIRDDAGEQGIRGVWDHDDCERFADRMQHRIERIAPGFGSKIAARRVLGPRELQARNANLIGGSLSGGTAQIHQELVFRPVPGLGRAETGIAGLYLGSASAHPGGGVHGACGSNAARAALLHHRLGGPRRLMTSVTTGRG